MNPLLRLVIEAGPLVVFFVANGQAGIFVATGAFMVATVVASALNYAIERRLPTMPLVSGLFVMAFGGLTLWLESELFIKLKPTIVNLLFATILLGGLAFGRPLLKPLFGAALQLNDEGWRTLTLRWGLFFIVLAVLNEIVWRSFSTDFWVSFKLFGIMPLTIVFALSQVPLINRTQLPEDTAEASSSAD